LFVIPTARIRVLDTHFLYVGKEPVKLGDKGMVGVVDSTTKVTKVIVRVVV
jgi:hypothetical protein